MATYDLKYPGAAIDAILDTAYDLQNAGYIFRGLASEYSNTPTERSWVLAGEGETGHGFTSPVPKGYIGVCVFNGTSWTGKLLKCVSIDSTPTSGSTNAVSSGGAYASISQLSASVTEALENLTFTDTTPSAFLGEYITEKVSTTNGGIERILTYFTILAATASKAGLLSAADKAKLDALWSSGYQFAGIATPSTTPISTTSKIFYIATEAGTYFNAVTVTQGINIIYKSGDTWSVAQVVGIDNEPTAGSDRLVKSGGVFGELALGAVYDVSAKNPTAGPNSNGKWESLSALLSDANLNTLIPTSVRKGGMSIKYVQSSDNKYMQARCMAQNFTTDVTQWQGVDEEPTVNSNNLVKSSGVFDSNIKLSGNIMSIKQNINNIGYCEIVKAQNGYVRNDGLLIYENTSSVEVMVFDVEGLDEVMLQSFNYSIGVKYYGFYTSIENRAESIDGKHEYVNGYTRISVPSTAKYLAVTTRFSNVGSFDMYKCFSLKTDIKQPSNIIQNKLCIVPLLAVCDGMYLSNTTGNIASAGASDINSIQSAIYSVEGLSEIIISPIDKSNVASASYYSFYANIADANCINGKKNYLVKADTVVSVPATAKYLIILTKFSNQGSYDNLLVTTNDVFRSIEKGLSLVPMYPVDGMLVRNDSFIGQSTIKSFTSDWINVSEGDTFVYQGFGSGSTTLTPSVVSSDSIGCSWLFRNQDHSITAYAIYNSNLTPIDVVIPSDVTAVRFSSISYFEGMYHKFAVVQKNSAIDNIVLHPLKQKRWVVVGDSLTEVNSATTKHYFDYIQENTGIRISNYGVGGSGYKERESEGRSIRQRIETVPVAYDVLTIFGSGNDLHTREGSSEMKYTMGDVTDQTSDTICGCINLTLDWLQANRPLQPVGIITPTPWNTSWGLPTDPDNRMSIYADKLVEIAKRHGVPCLDLYHESMLHPETAAFRNLAYTRDGTYTASQEGTTGAIQVSSWNIDAVQACGLPNAAIGDWVLPNLNGIHPDAHGHKLIYPMIQAFMEKILG